MSLKSHIAIMLVATIVAWTSWVIVLVQINPQHSGFLGFAAFYISFFLSLFGTFTVLGYSLRSIARVRLTSGYKLKTALRQSLLWSFALVIALALQSQKLLSLWSLIGLFIIFILVEFILSSIQYKVQLE